MTNNGMRKITFTLNELTALGPQGVGEKLADAGFLFTSKPAVCPDGWALKPPYRFQRSDADASVTFEQWERGPLQ